MVGFSGSPGSGVRVEIDQAALSHLLTGSGGDVERAFTVILNRIRNSAVGFCPVRTGRLRSSITVEPPERVSATNLKGGVSSNVEYAYWVHEGRGPVRPVRARVLHWVSPGGEDVFRPYAGPAAGQPFLMRAAEAVIQ